MRAVAAGVVLAVVMAVAPAAQARPSIVVQGVAKGHTAIPPMFENFAVEWECTASNAGTANVILSQCSFGGVNAVHPCMDCPTPPANYAVGKGTFRLGLDYQLCVTAYVYQPYQTVTRCAPYDYLTNTAVVAG